MSCSKRISRSIITCLTISQIAQEAKAKYGHKVYTLEDCTHGFGGSYNGRPNAMYVCERMVNLSTDEKNVDKVIAFLDKHKDFLV